MGFSTEMTDAGAHAFGSSWRSNLSKACPAARAEQEELSKGSRFSPDRREM
jgi:hypothetical protein